MNSFFEIAALVGLIWIAVSVGFAIFWSVLKKREPQIEEPEDVLARDI